MDWLLSLASSVGGYAGIFLVSVIGNLIPFMPIPYLTVVFLYTAYIPGASPLLVGTISGIGGGVGKLVVYLASMGASRLLSSETLRRLEAFKKLMGKYGALAVFIFAATPSPDDVVIAILGITRYSIAKFFVAVTLGKIVISVATAYFGKAMNFVVYENPIIGTVVTVVLLLLLTWLVIKIDWITVLEVVDREGWRGLLDRIRRGEIELFVTKRNCSRVGAFAGPTGES